MLRRQHALGQRGRGVVGLDRDPRLTQNRAVVDAFGDQMDRAARFGVAGGEGAGVGVEARIFRQQAGMDVQHPPGPVSDEKGRQQAHVAGQGDDLVLNTNALYRSAYALIYKAGGALDGVDSIFDERLKGKRIGAVQGTPSATLIAKAGLMDKARPYRLMVDRRYDDPSADMVKDIRSGEIDAGVMWGPIAGYYASRNGDKLAVVPLVKDAGKAGRVDFRVTMGVRQGDDLWKRQLNDIIRKRQADIDKVLLEYGVPMIDEDSKPITTPRS